MPRFKGGEKELTARIYVDGDRKIMKATLAPGASIGTHTHTGNCEAIMILSGSGYAIYDGVKEPVHAGLIHFCPDGHTHSLVNDSSADLEFYAVIM